MVDGIKEKDSGTNGEPSCLTGKSDNVLKQEEKSVFLKLKDKEYRNKVIHSLCLALSTFVLGLLVSQPGPAFLDLNKISGTDIEKGSSFFTAGSFGYIIGSVLSGVLHGKVNSHVLMFLTHLAAATTVILVPYCSSFWLMLLVRGGTGVFSGNIDNLANVEHLRLWRSEGQALLQFIHFTFALGGMLTPLYTEPFLSAKDMNSKINTTMSTHFRGNQAVYRNESSPSYFIGNKTLMMTNISHDNVDLMTESKETNVHYAFLISGVVAALCAFPYLVLYFKDKTKEISEDTEEKQTTSTRKVPRHLHIFMVSLFCLFYVAYCCVEDTFASFLLTFLVTKYDHVSKSEGAYITTFYWALFAVGRFISVFATKYLRAVQRMYLCSCIMVVAFVSFLISAHFGIISVLTVCSGLAGVGMSSLFPSAMSWSEAELMKVTATISTLIFIFSSVGVMVNPLFIGYLMEEVDPMWFCYILLGQTLLMMAIFLFLLFFNRCFVNVRYGLLQTQSSDVNVASPETTEMTTQSTVTVSTTDAQQDEKPR